MSSMLPEMRWTHGVIIALIIGAWKWADTHVRYFKARLNGYTIEKSSSHHADQLGHGLKKEGEEAREVADPPDLL